MSNMDHGSPYAFGSAQTMACQPVSVLREDPLDGTNGVFFRDIARSLLTLPLSRVQHAAFEINICKVPGQVSLSVSPHPSCVASRRPAHISINLSFLDPYSTIVKLIAQSHTAV